MRATISKLLQLKSQMDQNVCRTFLVLAPTISKTFPLQSKLGITRFPAKTPILWVSPPIDNLLLVQYDLGHKPELFAFSKRASFENSRKGSTSNGFAAVG